MLDLDLDTVAKEHAKELNKSIEKIAINLLYGLIFIGLCVFVSKR